MDRDPYDPCPCGSGNKLKFCCADVAGEMAKLERLLANNQPRMALQGLEKLYQTHPDSQWVRTLLASTLINENRPDEAKKMLAGLLKKHPEQPFANILYALSAFNADGYPDCKRAVHRAFKLSLAAYPELVGTLMEALAEHFESEGAAMAARQYMVLALRLAREPHRRELFDELVALDGDSTIPYPLRSVHNPVELSFSGDDQKVVVLATRYANVGCFEEAADQLEKLTGAHSENGGLWYNLGLFRAWDGDAVRAAVAFRKASQTFSDYDQAVECEVLAQLLERTDPARGLHMRLKRFNLSSVSQLLSRLDEADRIVRLEDRPQEEMSPKDKGPVARYIVLDRVLSLDEDSSEWTWESVPLIDARLTIFDREEASEEPAQAFLIGLEGTELDRAVETFVGAAGDLATPAPSDDDETEAQFSGTLSPEEVPLRWTAYVPPGFPMEVGRRTTAQRWQHVIDHVWPNTPQSALQGRTPLEAREKNEDKVALAAALIVLDAYADGRNYLLPLADLRERFHVDPPKPLAVGDGANIHLMSIQQLERLPWRDLDSEQFDQLLKRAMVTRQNRVLYEVIKLALERAESGDVPVPRDRMLALLAGLSAASIRRDEALEWIRQGRSWAESQDHAFESVLEWKMKELAFRIEDPQDEQLPHLLNDLWRNYGAKLPQLREYLVTMVEAAGVTPPWESAIVTSGASLGSSGDEWNPDRSGSPDSSKKLWLPGSVD